MQVLCGLFLLVEFHFPAAAHRDGALGGTGRRRRGYSVAGFGVMETNRGSIRVLARWATRCFFARQYFWRTGPLAREFSAVYVALAHGAGPRNKNQRAITRCNLGMAACVRVSGRTGATRVAPQKKSLGGGAGAVVAESCLWACGR